MLQHIVAVLLLCIALHIHINTICYLSVHRASIVIGWISWLADRDDVAALCETLRGTEACETRVPNARARPA